MKSIMLFLVFVTTLPLLVKATSFKMDFLSSGTVRTDPLMFSQIGQCLSDHVHRFYGAVSPRTMRPDVSYQDLRSATGNTGNVEENKSLYWNPAIYQVKNPNGDKTFEIVDVWFASAYYIFQTGQAKTFPSGLKMKTSGSNKLARARAVCDGAYTCERTDNGGCNGYGPSNQVQNGFLPVTGCGELEINIKFPTCWDGTNIESANGDHVAFSEECDGDEHNECFEFDCPASHPVKLPEIHLYVRVLGYEGGAHMFADGGDIFHSDYFSGWDETELQRVLDNCDNPSEAANPDAFCSDWLTFRGKGKEEGVQTDDDVIRSDLEEIQPALIDIKGTISAEEVTNIPEVPRGACTGTLIPDATNPTNPTTQATTPTTSTTSSPISSITCTKNTKETVKVQNGESYIFNTNEGNSYGPNIRCNVTYKKMNSCEKLKITCSKFSLGGGDILRVKRGKNKQIFKGDTGPSLETSAKTMKLFFKSNKKNHGAGATCTVSC